MNRYFITYKPYGIISQFSKENPEDRTLADLYDFPKDVYPVGRLDKDSEGLLLLTNDRKLNTRLLNPSNRHERSYWVQVEGKANQQMILNLEKGVTIRIKKKEYQTLPAKARLIVPAPALPERIPPIRYRKAIPSTWIELTLIEGKNRQVRRMCANLGYPVLRLVRQKIGSLTLTYMEIGRVEELTQKEVYFRLFEKSQN